MEGKLMNGLKVRARQKKKVLTFQCTEDTMDN